MHQPSSSTPCDIDFEVVRLLTQLALHASWSGAHEHAQRIVAGASAWCPDVAQIRNTEAMVLLGAGHSEAAVKVLTQTHELHPDDEMTKATLAFVLKQLDRPSWRTIAETVGLWGERYEAVWLARHTLGMPPDPSNDAAEPQAFLAPRSH